MDWFISILGRIAGASRTWGRICNYKIRVKARDIYGALSDWSEPLTIGIPRSKAFNFNFNLFS